jgi:hypothetical protein
MTSSKDFLQAASLHCLMQRFSPSRKYSWPQAKIFSKLLSCNYSWPQAEISSKLQVYMSFSHDFLKAASLYWLEAMSFCSLE